MKMFRGMWSQSKAGKRQRAGGRAIGFESLERREVFDAGTGTIIAPVAAVINEGGPGFGSINDTFDQSGLDANYISGVTNFDSYMSSVPKHTLVFEEFEWFSNEPTSGFVVTYDLGSQRTVDRLALWNEDASGIGKLTLQSSLDGTTFTTFASNLTPTDHPITDYVADVFSFAPVTGRYIRFVATESPQPNPGNFESGAIGEVAFRVASPMDTLLSKIAALESSGELSTRFANALRRPLQTMSEYLAENRINAASRELVNFNKLVDAYQVRGLLTADCAAEMKTLAQCALEEAASEL